MSNFDLCYDDLSNAKFVRCYISNAYASWIRLLRVPVPRFVSELAQTQWITIIFSDNEETSIFRHLLKSCLSITIIHCALTISVTVRLMKRNCLLTSFEIFVELVQRWQRTAANCRGCTALQDQSGKSS